MSYAQDLLGDPETVFKRGEDGGKSVGELERLLKSLSTIEGKYADDLSKVCQQSMSAKGKLQKEVGTLATAYATLFDGLTAIAMAHGRIRDALSEAASETRNFHKDKSSQQKQMLSEGQALTKKYKAAVAACDKAMATYHKACRDAEKAQGDFQNAQAQGKDAKALSKFSTKASAASDKQQSAESEYQQLLAAANQAQTGYFAAEMPQLLQDFEAAEKDRTRFTRQQLQQTAGNYEALPGDVEMATSSIAAAVQSIDEDADIESFCSLNSAAGGVPDEIPFQAFDPNNPDAAPTRASAMLGGGGSSGSPITGGLTAAAGTRGSGFVGGDSGGGAGSAGGAGGKKDKKDKKSKDSSKGIGGGNKAKSSIKVQSAGPVKSYGLSAADAGLSDDQKLQKLQEQLQEIEKESASQAKSKDGLQKLAGFYANDPVAQEQTRKEIAELEKILGELEQNRQKVEMEMQQLGGGGGGGGYDQGGYDQGGYDQGGYDQGGYNEGGYDEGGGGGGGGGGDGGDEDYYANAFQAKALYSYEATNDTELSFNEGDILTVTEQHESGWWYCELDGAAGFGPSNYFEPL